MSAGYGGSPIPPGVQSPSSFAPPPPAPPAPYGARLAALLIDAAVVAALAVAVVVAGILSADAAGVVTTVLVGVAAYVLAAVLYAPVAMALTGGRTLGKLALGLRVVREDGSGVGFGRGLLREVLVKGVALGIASGATGGLALLADAAWPFVDDRRRALHDLIAGTRVVRA